MVDRAPRRSTPEVKRLVLEAALDVFEKHGYTNAKTRDIALAAGVSEPVIFRHYESKARLFELVVLEAVSEFVQGFTRRWEEMFNQRPHDPALPVSDFVAGLYDLLYEKRHLMRVYLAAASLGEVDGIAAGDDLLGRLLQGFERIGEEEFPFLGLPDIDIQVAVRTAFGMVLSVAVFGDTMFPSDNHPGRQRIVDECTKVLVHGWSHRADS